MTTPAPTLPDTPQEALGLSDSPPLGRFPSLGGRNGARRRSRGPGGGLPSNPLGRSTPRTPGTLSPSERRAQAKSRLQVVRPEPKSEPAKPPAEGLTAKGAPVRNPREVPKTGKARDERDAIRHGMSQDTRRAHEGWSADTQDAFNKLNRATQDIDRRDAGDVLTQHFKDLRERRLRDAREARKPTRQRTPEQKAAHQENLKPFREAMARERADREKQGSVQPGLPGGNVVDEFPIGRHQLTVEEGDTLLKRAKEHDEQ